MACFEDAGYFCVDNLPPEMIGQLADLFGARGQQGRARRGVCDARGGEYFDGLVKVLDGPRASAASSTGCCSSRRPSRC